MTTNFTPKANSWYVLRFLHSNLALSSERLTTDSKVLLTQETYDGLGHQQWSFTHVEGDWYVVSPRFGGKAINVARSSTEDRADVLLYPVSGTLNEQWRIEAHPQGGYLFYARHSGKVLDVRAASGSAGSQVIQYNKDGNQNQRLLIEELPAAEAFRPESGAAYRLRFAHSGFVLNVARFSTADGAELVQYPLHNYDNELWLFEEVDPGWYVIRPRYVDKVLDLRESSAAEGATLHLWTAHGGHNQQWKLEPFQDGYYLRNRKTGGMVSVRSGALTPTEVEQSFSGGQKSCILVDRAADPLAKSHARQALRVPDFTGTLRLPLIRAFGPARETTVEAWVRPASATSSGHQTLVELGARGARFAIQRDERRILVRVYYKDKTHTYITSSTSTLTANVWTHVCATVRHDNGDNSYDLELYINGSRVKTGRAGSSKDDARKVFASTIQMKSFIGSEEDGSNRFQGELAHVRFWDYRRSASEIVETHRKRVRGDEDRLAASYPFEEVVAGQVQDSSLNRLHIPVQGGRSVGAGSLPPVSSVGDFGRIQAEGQLVAEWLEESMIDDGVRSVLGRLTEIGGSGTAPPSLNELGRRAEGLIELHVFEVVVAPQDRDGQPLPDEWVNLWLVEQQVALVEDPDGSSRAEVWNAGDHRLRTASDGTLRVRFIAVTPAGALVYARFAGMPWAVWSPIDANTDLYARMHNVTAGEIQNPSSGVGSPLPGATTQEAEALAEMVQGLAWAGAEPLPESDPGPRSVLNKFKNVFDDLGNAFENGGNVVWEGTTSTSELVASSTGSLIVETSNKVVQVGRQAIIRSIAGAEKIGITIDETLAKPTVMIVGKAVNGDYWRVVVLSVRDAAAALASILERVGASIHSFLKFLAGLFDWAAILAESDEVYDDIRESLANAAGTIENFSPVSQYLDSYLSPAPDSPHFDLSLREINNVALDGGPSFKELNRVVRYASRILGAGKLDVDFGAPTPDFSSLVGLDATRIEQAFKQAMPAMISSPSGLLNDPARPVFELPAGLWSTIRDDVNAICDAMFGLSAGVIEGLDAVLTKRFSNSVAARLFEKTILSADGTHRQLNFLRLVALLVAIPTVLGRSSSENRESPGTTRAEESGPETQQEKDARRGYRRAARIGAGLNIAHAFLWSARAGVTAQKSSEQSSILLCALQSPLLFASSYFEAQRASYANSFKPTESVYASTGSLIMLMDGLCCFSIAALYTSPWEDEPDSSNNEDLIALVNVIGGYGVGLGWLATASARAEAGAGGALGWELAYWLSTWTSAAITNTNRKLAQDWGGTMGKKLHRNATGFAVVAFAANVAYSINANT